VYGVGLLLYILMSAEDPHISYAPASNSKPAPLSFDSDHLIYNSNFDSFKPELRHIVKSMLRSNPSKRPSVEELLKLELLGEERIIKCKRKDEKRIKEVFNNRSQEEERSHSSDGNPTEKSSKSSSILMQKSSATQVSSPSTMSLPGLPSHQSSQNNTQAGHAQVPDSTTDNNDPIPLLNVFLPHWPAPTPVPIPDQSSHNNIHHSIPYVNSHKITSLHFTTTSNITMGGNCIDTDQFPVEGKVHSPPSINFSPGIN
jgi:serine/threonine protein kinase